MRRAGTNALRRRNASTLSFERTWSQKLILKDQFTGVFLEA